MHKDAFAGLVEKLRPLLTVERSDAVPVELQLSIFLRMAAGGSHYDVADMHGFNETHCYELFDRVTLALDTVLKLPWESSPSTSDLHTLATDFAAHTATSFVSR
jgi:hypothetical protein